MRRSLLLAAVAFGVVVAAPIAVLHGQPGDASAKAKPESKLYIVQMSGAPVTAYAGGIPGYLATKPARGQKIDPNDAKVIRYGTYLTGRHDAVIAAVGGARKAYSYVYSFNGFAAELTDEQAAALLQRLDRVLTVEVLRRMKPPDAGAVLERMKGEAAAELFSAMASASCGVARMTSRASRQASSLCPMAIKKPP